MLTILIIVAYAISVLTACAYGVWVYKEIDRIKAKIDHVCKRGNINIQGD